MCNSSHAYGREAGSTILLMMTLLVITLSAILLEGWTARHARFSAWLENAKVLGVARDAVVSYATGRAERGARLPCPDRAGEGLAEVSCLSGEGVVVGSVPWRTLGVMPLRTEEGEGVWYAVARPFLQAAPGTHSAPAEWMAVEQGRGPWAAVLFVPSSPPRPGERMSLPVVLRDAQWLPVTVADLAGVSGGNHDPDQ